MNAIIEMYDSECVAIEVAENGSGFVLLDAYVHRCEEERLVSSHEGGMQRVRLKFEGMTKEGEVDELPADIYDGSLIVGTDTRDAFRFPAVFAEPVRLTMTFRYGARVVVVSGRGLSIESEGEFLC